MAYFKPLKVSWRATLLDWKSKNRGTLPKDMFPRILNKCLLKLDENDKTSQNLKAGFKSSGIYPTKRENVLKLLPSQTEPAEPDNAVIDNAFEIFLKNLYNKETQPLRPRIQKKKLSVAAGASVSSFASIENLDSDDELPSFLKSKLVYKRAKKSSDTESDSESYSTQESSDSPEDFEENHEDDLNLENLKIDDFVLVEIPYSAPTKKIVQRRFIGQVVTIQSEPDVTVLCNFLRSSSKAANIYVFPEIPDSLNVKGSQIISHLKPNFIRRGRHCFPISL